VALYERDAYKKAKEENDERFMRESDEAQAEVKRLRVSSGRLYDALRQLHEACCCSCRTCQSAKVEAYDAMEAYKEGK
jgi:hypothetical protein